MKYLRKFATEAEIDVDVEPNVVLVSESNRIFYNVKKGVFIQHIDGSLYTIEDWSAKGFANDEANGVAVCSNEASFVIAKERKSNRFGGKGKIVPNIVTTKNKDEALLDFGGLHNTSAIVTELNGYIDSEGTSGSPVASACANYVFPNGRKGYLPSMGEFSIIARYMTDIETALSYIGGAKISTGNFFWLSTQGDSTSEWCAYVTQSGETSFSMKDKYLINSCVVLTNL